MSASLKDVFADTAFWVALIVKQDQHHVRAQQWSLQISGRIVTTAAVLLETANTLARPAWRSSCVALINHLEQRSDIRVVSLAQELWRRGWDLFCDRPDKSWSLTDCLSFLIMQDENLHDALTTDDHFRQAGFRAILLEDPEDR
jgi:predicted nucleic acid-binding protein